jgi:hypothetical protein
MMIVVARKGLVMGWNGMMLLCDVDVGGVTDKAPGSALLQLQRESPRRVPPSVTIPLQSQDTIIVETASSTPVSRGVSSDPEPTRTHPRIAELRARIAGLERQEEEVKGRVAEEEERKKTLKNTIKQWMADFEVSAPMATP